MKTRLMLAAGMIMSIGLLAQNQTEVVRTDRSNDLKTMLSLDDKQYASIQKLNEKYATRRAEVRKETQNEMKALRTEREKEFEAVLTPEQKAKWETHKTEREAKRKEHQQEAVKNQQARVKRELLLSSEQAEKLFAENKAFGEKRKQLMDSKKSPADKDAFIKLRDDHKKTVQQILNEEQFKKWESMRNHRHPHRKGHHRGR